MLNKIEILRKMTLNFIKHLKGQKQQMSESVDENMSKEQTGEKRGKKMKIDKDLEIRERHLDTPQHNNSHPPISLSTHSLINSHPLFSLKAEWVALIEVGAGFHHMLMDLYQR